MWLKESLPRHDLLVFCLQARAIIIRVRLVAAALFIVYDHPFIIAVNSVRVKGSQTHVVRRCANASWSGGGGCYDGYSEGKG